MLTYCKHMQLSQLAKLTLEALIFWDAISDLILGILMRIVNFLVTFS